MDNGQLSALGLQIQNSQIHTCKRNECFSQLLKSDSKSSWSMMITVLVYYSCESLFQGNKYVCV